ncbi:hypothetical protein [Zhihengliuella salsuginis]|uniref:AbiEi antitoxin C-terminal domain-containing protein n=1 Tax=Zhihengliuella salsuginis TaxID=578222 RepID=A0ABQ3GMJ4_9MICC|nr:hypothetical protein [Zhihengliuella salsuginis]GHD12101.1 hypothetical protein GCM10008096_27200 [Zhihengliuella salsuginis]
MDNRGGAGGGREFFVEGSPFRAGELTAMEREGTLERVLPGLWAPAPFVDTAQSRARAVALVLSGIDAVAVCGETAAWLYGVAESPRAIDTVVKRFLRSPRNAPGPPLRIVSLGVGPSDVLTMSGVPLTTPLRTAFDAAVHFGDDRDAVRVVRRFLRSGHLAVDVESLVAKINEVKRRPGKLRALARVDDAARGLPHQPVVLDRAG